MAADDIPLSTAHGRETAYIAVHVYQGTAYDQYFQGVEHIMDDYGGRPHWGKLHYQSAATLAPRYPRWDDFRPCGPPRPRGPLHHVPTSNASSAPSPADPPAQPISPYWASLRPETDRKDAQYPDQSDQGPGVAAAGVVHREATVACQGAGTGHQGLVAFERIEQGHQRGGEVVGGQPAHVLEQDAAGTGSPPNSQITVRSLNS